MSTTVATLIADVLNTVGGDGFTPTQEQTDRAFRKLKNILANESLDRGMLFDSTILSTPLVVGTNEYLFGTGEVFTSRPNYVDLVYIVGADNERHDVDLLDEEEYHVRLGDLTEELEIPYFAYYKPLYPTSKLTVYPIPDTAGYTLYVHARFILQEITSVSTTLLVPDEYISVLENKLLRAIASSYGYALTREDREVGLLAEQNLLKVNSKKNKLTKNIPSELSFMGRR